MRRRLTARAVATRRGKSVLVHLPLDLARTAGIHPGSRALVTAERGRVTVEPISSRRQLPLERLVRSLKGRHPREVDFGTPVGRELIQENVDRTPIETTERAMAEAIRVGAWSVFVAADQTFGSMEAAVAWMSTPQRLLGGRTPYELIATREGQDEVRRLLRLIDYGDYT